MWADQHKNLEPEIGHFELEKNQKSRSQSPLSRAPRHWTNGKSGNFGDPFLSATTSWTLKKCFIIMWADQRKLLEPEIGHFELQKNRGIKIRVSGGPRETREISTSISECNHLLDAQKEFHNYVGRSAEASRARDRPF